MLQKFYGDNSINIEHFICRKSTAKFADGNLLHLYIKEKSAENQATKKCAFIEVNKTDVPLMYVTHRQQ